MAFNINDIRSQLQLGGARPYLFQVAFTNPSNSAGTAKVPFMCESASLPEATVNQIPVAYMGRTIKVAGTRDYQNWNVTIINDEDFLIRNALEEWSNDINSFEGNLNRFGTANPSAYKQDAIITQLGKTGNVIRTYKFKGIFPAQISSIDMNWQNNTSIERFQVSFSYDWWTVEGATGDAGGVA